MPRGGLRPGAGRKPVPSKAYLIRIDLADVQTVENCLHDIEEHTGESRNTIMKNALVRRLVQVDNFIKCHQTTF